MHRKIVLPLLVGLVLCLAATRAARAARPPDTQDIESRIAGVLTRLRSRYIVVWAEINSYAGPEYGGDPSAQAPAETNLHVELQRADFPANLSDALVLSDGTNGIQSVDEFLRSADRYESLFLSVPWLNQYVQAHPKVLVRISYVHSDSIGDKAMAVFGADMHAIGRDDLAAQVHAMRSQIALLIAGNAHAESYWLLFPDKRMVLWRYQGRSGLLKFHPGAFRAGPCAEYRRQGRCAGTVISADGVLER